jgi:hypothetical protein
LLKLLNLAGLAAAAESSHRTRKKCLGGVKSENQKLKPFSVPIFRHSMLVWNVSWAGTMQAI